MEVDTLIAQKRCDNCGRIGHLKTDCRQPGGGAHRLPDTLSRPWGKGAGKAGGKGGGKKATKARAKDRAAKVAGSVGAVVRRATCWRSARIVKVAGATALRHIGVSRRGILRCAAGYLYELAAPPTRGGGKAFPRAPIGRPHHRTSKGCPKTDRKRDIAKEVLTKWQHPKVPRR